MNETNHRPAPARAFTLVELLVVIGIIALLISILLPSLNAAKRQAVSLKCLSNLRSLGQAFQLYGNDNKGVILPNQFWGRDAAGTVQAEPWMFALVAGRYLPDPHINAADQSAAKNSVLVCPAIIDALSYRDAFPAAGLPVFTTTTVPDGFDRRLSKLLLTAATIPLPCSPSNGANGACILDNSYGINGPTDGGQDARAKNMPSQSVWLDTATHNSRTYNPVKHFSDFKKSSLVILLLDGTDWNMWTTTTGRTGFWHVSGSRHGQWRNIPGKQYSTGITNTLFVDGHCETVPRADLPGETPADNVDMMLGDAKQAKNNRYLWNLTQ